MIDSYGYRANVAMILCNEHAQVLWARRCGMDAWQFPQGGINAGETPEQAMYRELMEEVGLSREAVEILGVTKDWLRYDLPKRYRRKHCKPACIGQKQIWFVLRVLGSEDQVKLNCCKKPEFDCWKWVDYWSPMSNVIEFKRGVYREALIELAPLVLPAGSQSPPNT